MIKIKLTKNYFDDGTHYLAYSCGENSISGMGWKDNQLNSLKNLVDVKTGFYDEKNIEVSDDTMRKIHKMWNSFKSYHLVDNKNDKKIAYPGDMQKSLVDALEKARKNKSFVTLTSGNMETGEAWGDLCDAKGRIGLSRGQDYLYPILVSFKTGYFDEDLDETVGESYDFLSEFHTSDISSYLDNNFLELEDVLDDGGTTIASVVAVQTGLSRIKLEYKHVNFFSKYDFGNTSEEIETITTTCSVISDKTNITKETTKKENRHILFVEGKVYSRHNTKKDLQRFLKASKQINLQS